MTRTEAHIAFKIETDKNAVNIGMSGCPSFLPEEIDYWLQSAMLSKIATKFTGNNAIKIPFDSSVKRISDLQGLIKTDKELVLTEGNDNSLTLANFTNNGQRMYFVNAVLHFGEKSASVILIRHQDINKFRKTYNNRPWIENPVCVIDENSIEILIDSDLMSGPFTLDLTYVKFPDKIDDSISDSENCMKDIPEYMQYEIVKLAADMAIENIESQRVQTHQSYVTQLSE